MVSPLYSYISFLLIDGLIDGYIFLNEVVDSMQGEVARHTQQLNDILPGLQLYEDALRSLQRELQVNQNVVIGLARRLDEKGYAINDLEERLRKVEDLLAVRVDAEADIEEVNKGQEVQQSEPLADVVMGDTTVNANEGDADLSSKDTAPTDVEDESAMADENRRSALSEEIRPTELAEEDRPSALAEVSDRSALANESSAMAPPPPPPPAPPAVTLQPPTPQTSQEAANQTTLLAVPTDANLEPLGDASTQSTAVADSQPHQLVRGRSSSPLPSTEPLRRSPRLRSPTPSPSTVPTKRSSDNTVEEQVSKKQRGE